MESLRFQNSVLKLVKLFHEQLHCLFVCPRVGSLLCLTNRILYLKSSRVEQLNKLIQKVLASSQMDEVKLNNNTSESISNNIGVAFAAV